MTGSCMGCAGDKIQSNGVFRAQRELATRAVRHCHNHTLCVLLWVVCCDTLLSCPALHSASVKMTWPSLPSAQQVLILHSADFGKSVCVELVAGLLTCTVASVDRCHQSCHCWLQIKECPLGTRTCKRPNAHGSQKYRRSILFMETRPGDPCTPLLVCLFRPRVPPPGACVLHIQRPVPCTPFLNIKPFGAVGALARKQRLLKRHVTTAMRWI